MTTITLQPGQSTEVSVGGTVVATVTAAQPQPQPPVRKLYFGYFWGGADQVPEWADHCNVVQCPSGGNWTTPDGLQGIMSMSLLTLKTAKAAGISKAIVTVDFCGFLPGPNGTKVYRGSALARENLTNYFSQLHAGGVLDMMVCAYVADEPEREAQIPASDLTSFCADIRSVAGRFTELAAGIALAIIYGDGQDYRALSSIDWAGVDAYGRGASVLTTLYPGLKARLRADQSLILVPGGASPWQTPPDAFYAYSQSNPVAWISPFIWLDHWGGTQNLGIKSNGQAPAYRSVGLQIKST